MIVDLSIVIVSWNIRELLRRCLESVLRQPVAVEVIVVDNASTDGSPEIVARDFPQVRLIRNADNPGFSAANNQGLAIARGRHLMILNPDTEVIGDALATLVRYVDQHPDVGVVGPQLLNPDGTVQSSRRRFPTLRTAVFESTWLQPWAPAGLLDQYYVLDRPDEETLDVDWVTGAAVVVRREAFAQVGGLDAGYFMYSEELDWCKRFKLAGWRVVYLPKAQIIHYEGKSSEQAVPARHIHFQTSKVRYFHKYHGPWAAEFVRGVLLLNYASQWLLEAAKGILGHKRALRWQRVRMYGQVLRSGLRAAPRSRAKPPFGAIFNLQSPISDRPLRIGLVTGEYPPQQGGVGDFTRLLGQALAEQGHEVHILTRAANRLKPNVTEKVILEADALAGYGPGTYPAKASTSSGSTGFLSAFSLFPPNLKSYSTSVEDLVEQDGKLLIHPLIPTWDGQCWKILANAAQSLGLDVLDVQIQPAAYDLRGAIYLLPLVGRLLGQGFPPVIATFHDLRVPYLFPKAGPLRPWLVETLARTSQGAVATNAEDGVRLQPLVRRLAFIPIGSNIAPTAGRAERDLWRQRWGIAADELLLVHFGFMNRSKGIDVLLQALAQLWADALPTRLLLLGGQVGSSDATNAAYLAEMRHLVETLGVTQALIWTDFLPAEGISAALVSADIAVFPYRQGASLRHGTLLAALAHGLPIVTTRPWVQTPASPLPSLTDDVNVVLAPAGDPAALATAVRDLWADPVRRERLGQAARELAQQFCWERIAQMRVALYREQVMERPSKCGGMMQATLD